MEENKNEQQLLEAMTQQTDYCLTIGTSLSNDSEKATKEEIIEAIRGVYDPEIPVNVYDMGLIYQIDIKENGDIHIDMTLTAPGCPVADILPRQVAEAVSALEGTGKTTVKLVWEPLWSIEKMTEEGRAMVDLF